MDNEVIYPPQGYWIGCFGVRADGMIGPFATEAEARDALANCSIAVTGQLAEWGRNPT